MPAALCLLHCASRCACHPQSGRWPCGLQRCCLPGDASTTAVTSRQRNEEACTAMYLPAVIIGLPPTVLLFML
jgi:hypothetical protein